MHQGKATSFAGLSDLVAYIDCLVRGKTPDSDSPDIDTLANYCLNTGDNGRGCWGDITAQLRQAMCAVSENDMIAQWGSKDAARGKSIHAQLVPDENGVVQGHGNPFQVQVYDDGPQDVIDLNPAALVAAGLAPDTELSCPVQWQWV